MSSSYTDTVYFLWSPCLSLFRCHTQPLGCLTAVSPPSCSCSVLVWRQAAGVLWLKDQRASERWSPSELCRWRRRESLHFRLPERVFLCAAESASYPDHKRNTPAWFSCVSDAQACFAQAAFWLGRMWTACCWAEVSLGRDAAWVHMHAKTNVTNEERTEGGWEKAGGTVFHQVHFVQKYADTTVWLCTYYISYFQGRIFPQLSDLNPSSVKRSKHFCCSIDLSFLAL